MKTIHKKHLTAIVTLVLFNISFAYAQYFPSGGYQGGALGSGGDEILVVGDTFCNDIIVHLLSDTAISSGTYRARDTLYANCPIESPDSVTVTAGIEVVLLNGLQIDSGARFHAYIKDCFMPALPLQQGITILEEEMRAEPAKEVQEKRLDERKKELPPYELALQCIPNPFREEANIQFILKESVLTTLAVYSLTGNCVKTLINNQWLETGFHSYVLEAGDLAAGIYIVRLKAGDGIGIGKLVLVR